jgi:hypothetical protein
MKKLSGKQALWAIVAILIVGFVFLIWGSHIYHQYPGIKETRHIEWLATKSAGIQYILAIVVLYGGYIFIRIKSK